MVTAKDDSCSFPGVFCDSETQANIAATLQVITIHCCGQESGSNPGHCPFGYLPHLSMANYVDSISKSSLDSFAFLLLLSVLVTQVVSDSLRPYGL